MKSLINVGLCALVVLIVISWGSMLMTDTCNPKGSIAAQIGWAGHKTCSE